MSAVRLGPVTSVENAPPVCQGELSDQRRRIIEGRDERGGGTDRGVGQSQHADRSVLERRLGQEHRPCLRHGEAPQAETERRIPRFRWRLPAAGLAIRLKSSAVPMPGMRCVTSEATMTASASERSRPVGNGLRRGRIRRQRGEP